MKSRYYVLILACALSGPSALADDATACIVTTMQNNAAMEKYNDAWKDFNASFNRDIPALKAHAKQAYAQWSKIASMAPKAFGVAMGELSDGQYQGDKPANYLSRRAEEQLNAYGKDQTFLASFFPNEKSPVQRTKNWKTMDLRVSVFERAETDAQGNPTYTVNADGEPLFGICMDEVKPFPQGISFICGTVTRFDIPNVDTFVSDYVNDVRRSRVINGSPDLVKPTMLSCNPDGQNQAAAPKSDDDASDPKVAPTGGDNTPAVKAPRTWGGSTDAK